MSSCMLFSSQYQLQKPLVSHDGASRHEGKWMRPDSICSGLKYDQNNTKTHFPAYFQVLLPGTCAPEICKVFLEPDLQVKGCDAVPCLPEEVQSQAAVHTATQKDSHLESFATALFTPAWKIFCWSLTCTNVQRMAGRVLRLQFDAIQN